MCTYDDGHNNVMRSFAVVDAARIRDLRDVAWRGLRPLLMALFGRALLVFLYVLQRAIIYRFDSTLISLWKMPSPLYHRRL